MKEVICINASGAQETGLKEGELYYVFAEGKMDCLCGIKVFDIGFVGVPGNLCFCPLCGTDDLKSPFGNRLPFSQRRFVVPGDISVLASILELTTER